MIPIESDFLINYEHLLAKRKWLNIYDLIADVCVDVYPYIQEIDEKKYPVIYPIADKLSRYISTDASIDKSCESRPILKEYFFKIIKHDIDFSMLSTFSSYLLVIERLTIEGDIIFNQDWSDIFLTSWGVPLFTQYDDRKSIEGENKERKENYSLNQIEIKTEQKSVENIGPKHDHTKVKDQKSNDHVCHKLCTKYFPQTNEERELENFWRELTANDYDEIYIWRNKISLHQYEKLKKRIFACKIEQRKQIPEHFPNILLTYIGEWYKREYNGNDSMNPLEELGITKNAKTIWENITIPRDFLYAKRNNLYLESIYVLGGLPINYIMTKHYGDIFKEISKLVTENISPSEQREEIKESVFCNNYVVQKSLFSETGSLHLYFNNLLDGNVPFADEDLEIDAFRYFLANLKKWTPIRQKFSYEWIIEGNLRTEILRRKFRLHFLPESSSQRHKSLSYQRLSSLGIDTSVKHFGLYLCLNDMQYDQIDRNNRHIDFFNTYDGYFVAKIDTNSFTFPDIDSDNIHTVKLLAILDNYKRKIIETIDVNPFLQLYETDSYSVLSSKKRMGKSYALLPFSTPIKEHLDYEPLPKFFKYGGQPYKLLQIIDSITPFSNEISSGSMYNHEISIKVQIKHYEDTISYNKGRLLYHYIGDDNEIKEQSVELIFGLSDLSIIKCERNFDEIELPLEEIVIGYKEKGSSNFTIWTEQSSPKQGFITLRIVALGIEKQINVYYIPCNKKPIERDIENKLLMIHHSVRLLKEPENLKLKFITQESRCYQDFYYNEYENSICTLLIGENSGYLELPIIRPYNVLDIYRDGKLFKCYKDRHIASADIKLPILLKNHYMIRKIDDNGLNFINLAEINVSYLDFDFSDELESICKVFEYKISAVKIKFYLCQPLSAMTYTINIGADTEKNYRFYYWSMNPEDEPVLLIQEAEGERLQLHLNTKQKKSGIIFQSLNDDVCPYTYFAPLILGEWKTHVTTELVYKCVDLSIKYGTPFRIFYPVYELLKGSDSSLVDLFATYLGVHQRIDTDIKKYDGLFRLSKELYFSWQFLNIKCWLEMRSNVFKKLQITDEDVQSKLKIDETLIPNVRYLFNRCNSHKNYENQHSLAIFTDVYWGNMGQINLISQKDNYNENKENSQPEYFLASPFGDPRWFCYNENGSSFEDKIPEIARYALKFMRPYPKDEKICIENLSKPGQYKKQKISDIFGFTNEENPPKKFKTSKGVAIRMRKVEECIKFLRMLEQDSNAFVVIEQCLRKYLNNSRKF